MLINDWLSENKVSQVEFCNRYYKESGNTLTQGAISKWANNERIPRKEEMKIIFAITNGVVQPNDFYNL
tara:strand:+ start:7455 stop:7661 length:207 start_codon:yes stop_codon:yes gene_type:complete